jgi:adenosylcobinamide-phosphate synthase
MVALVAERDQSSDKGIGPYISWPSSKRLTWETPFATRSRQVSPSQLSASDWLGCSGEFGIVSTVPSPASSRHTHVTSPSLVAPSRRYRSGVPRPSSLPAGLLIGTVLDALVPDPRRGHPVSIFGAAAGAVERRAYADSRPRGVAFAGGCVGAAITLGFVLPDGTLTVAASTWAVLGGRSLRREARAVHDLLSRDDLAAARTQVRNLVGRDPAGLDAGGIVRAAVESVAENTCDAIVAPLFWGAVAGVPGLLGYRAVNTLDAMVGHRTARYVNFGWAAARLDDLANLVPARLTAGLVALASGRAVRTLRVTTRDGHRHPSPNAGYAEAAYAGALALRLGGRNVYAGRVEHRPDLGDGPPPRRDDIPRAARLCAAVTIVAAVTAAVLARAVRGSESRLHC